MRVRMLQTVDGSPNGGTVKTYQKGEVYEFGSVAREADLADLFIRAGLAVDADAAPQDDEAGKDPETIAPPKFHQQRKGKGI